MNGNLPNTSNILSFSSIFVDSFVISLILVVYEVFGALFGEVQYISKDTNLFHLKK